MLEDLRVREARIWLIQISFNDTVLTVEVTNVK